MQVRIADLTLVAIDCRAHALTSFAIADTILQIEPANAMVWSDRPEAVPRGVSWIKCPEMSSLREVASVLWWDMPYFVNTTHFLLVQWDGWVLNSNRWCPEFLKYDYVGAPWWFQDELNVGNGGFSLRSVRLSKYLAEHFDEFPLREPEDYILCREYRPLLEQRGFCWAPEPLARRFAFERQEPIEATFGFHGHFNWPKILSDTKLSQRLALANDYVRKKPLF